MPDVTLPAATSAAATSADRPRKGDWTLTASGRKVWPLDPRLGDFHAGDAAHHLCHIGRFGGATGVFWPVVAHSLLVSHVLQSAIGNAIKQYDKPALLAGIPRDNALHHFTLAGLLHDAQEAFLIDLPTPIKVQPEFALYRDAEHAWQDVIAAKHGLLVNDPDAQDLNLLRHPLVAAADAFALQVERSLFLPDHPEWPVKTETFTRFDDLLTFDYRIAKEVIAGTLEKMDRDGIRAVHKLFLEVYFNLVPQDYPVDIRQLIAKTRPEGV